MDRAKALRVRLVPFLVTWGLLAGVVGVVVWQVAKQWPAGALLALLLFATLTAVTYYRLNRTDYDYSREGTERHRLDTAADLARRQMNHEHELRRMALDTYLRTLERHEGGGR
jgi:CHASE3 domain sensor protein